MRRLRLSLPIMVAALVMSTQAFARAYLEGSTPPAKPTVTDACAVLRPILSEGVEPGFPVVEAAGPGGEAVLVAARTTAPGATQMAGTTLEASSRPGACGVASRVVPEAGHQTHGAHGFAVAR